MKSPKIAIVYDWIDKWGGVERVLLALHSLYPEAIFYTSYIDLKNASWARKLTVKTSFIQRLPRWIRQSRILSFIFYSLAFESFDFKEFDTVISVTSSFAKSIVTQPKTRHICYLLTPTRYLWVYPEEYMNGLIQWLINPYLEYIRHWDLTASQRPDVIISLSNAVKDRCNTHYGIPTKVVYPPFNVEYWEGILRKIKATTSAKTFPITSSERKVYFLVVSRLEPYKKVEIAIEACKRTGLGLIVVGKGSKLASLKKMASPQTQFLQDISDTQLVALYRGAEALIMSQNEDFGYTSLEAQLCGCPVIAYGRGGNRETVVDGKTGIFFQQQNVEGLISVLARWDKISYNLKRNTNLFGKGQVEKFSQDEFISRFEKIIS